MFENTFLGDKITSMQFQARHARVTLMLMRKSIINH